MAPNKVVTFLSKAGQAILALVPYGQFFAPLLKALTPDKVDPWIDTGVDKLDHLASVVMTTEAMVEQIRATGGTVADKAVVAGPLVAQVILASSLVAGREIRDRALFLQGCSRIGGGVADVLNSLKAD